MSRRNRKRCTWCILLCCALFSLACLQFSFLEVSTQIHHTSSQANKDKTTAYIQNFSTIATRLKSSTYDDICPVFRLQSEKEKPQEEVACIRAEFVPGSCRIMKELFADKEPANCSHQLSDVICTITQLKLKKPYTLGDWQRSSKCGINSGLHTSQETKREQSQGIQSQRTLMKIDLVESEW
ncbi:uncharacterized protein [Hemitrygon akajei]|uniref:uncharacterized protein isoform X2 n=1 Tax=Hemitrygon akajei TaxID=2704970 RepID=UPI003BF992EC